MIQKTPLFDLNLDRRELRIQGKLINLPPKAFALLSHLYAHRDRMVSKRELMEAFWSSNSSEAALLKTISLIRKELADNDAGDSGIKTYHGLGYRFVDSSEQPTKSPEDDSSPIELEELQWIAVICIHLPTQDLGSHNSAHLDAYMSHAQSTVERHQGQLLHMMGDGFSATFTQQSLCEDVARQAVICAETLKQESLISKVFSLKIGIDIGAIPKTKQEKSWQAPSAIERRATHLVRLADTGAILLSEKTVEYLQGEIAVKTVKDGFLLLNPPRQRSGIPGRPKAHPSKFVGRTAELAFLDAKLESVSSGRGQAVLLSGPAGIGKTRLVSEFLIEQNTTNSESILLHCFPHFSNTALTPISDLCEHLLQVTHTDITAMSEVEQALTREILGTPLDSEPALEGLTDHEHRKKSYLLLDKILTEASLKTTLILVLEDAHWMDATSQEYLSEIVRNLEEKKLLLIVTSRPTETLSFVDAVLHLSPLSQNVCLALLKDNEETQNISDDDANILVERSAGNPFFLEELAFATSTGADPNAPPPETVQAVISARIANLSSDLRALLYIISVASSPAPIELITYLYGKNDKGITSKIKHLVKSGFILEEMTFLSFRHMLINDAAYAMISKADRRHLHLQIAQYLEQRINLDNVRSEVIAKHYQEAGENELAISYWIKATRTSLQSSVLHETVVFAKQGLALLDTTQPEHKAHGLKLELMLASALIKLKGFGNIDAGQAYLNAQELNKAIGSAKSTVRILVGLWINEWVRGNLTSSLAYGNELMTLAQRSDNPPLILQAHASMGQVLMHLGRTKESFEHLCIGLETIHDHPPETIPEQNAAVSCAAYAAWTGTMLGRSTDAKRYFEHSEILSQLIKNPFAEAIHCALCAAFFMHEGNVESCLEISNQAISISREHDFDFWLATGLVLRGWALGQQNKMGEAFTAFDEGIEVFESTSAGVQLANWYGLKAEILLKAGKLQEGIHAVSTALGHVERTGDVYFSARIHAVAQSLNEELGNLTEADTHGKKALKLAERFGFSAKVIALNHSESPTP